MENDTCLKCHMPLDDDTKCECNESICKYCCECDEGCTCGCHDK